LHILERDIMYVSQIDNSKNASNAIKNLKHEAWNELFLVCIC